MSDASSNNNNKLYWKLIKDAFYAKPTKDIPPIQYTSDTGEFNIAFTDTEKVDVLNKYFSSVSNVDDTLNQLPQLYHICNDKLNNVNIEEQEVIDIIKILPVNKAIGPDTISHKMLKSTLQSVAKPLCLLFNKSLTENVYPNNWKIAHVLPLFKKDDPSVATNYRPVSLLSCVSKIMERIIFKHVYNYFIKNNLFYKYQAGFLPGHSTLYQLLETYHSIVKAIDDSSWPSSIFDVC